MEHRVSTRGRVGHDERESTTSPVGLLSWKNAARYLSLSESSLRRLVRAGRIAAPVEVTDGRMAFPFEDVEAFRQEVIARSRRP
jgi:excisionase family DNA binding protein